jgi:hypothetical protein
MKIEMVRIFGRVKNAASCLYGHCSVCGFSQWSAIVREILVLSDENSIMLSKAPVGDRYIVVATKRGATKGWRAVVEANMSPFVQRLPPIL